MRPIERKKITENEAAAEAAMEAAEAAQTDADTADGKAVDAQEDIDALKSTGEQYLPFTDGTTNIRVGVRATKFVVDKTLTATGFAGVEDTDWANMVSLPQA